MDSHGHFDFWPEKNFLLALCGRDGRNPAGALGGNEIGADAGAAPGEFNKLISGSTPRTPLIISGTITARSIESKTKAGAPVRTAEAEPLNG